MAPSARRYLLLLATAAASFSYSAAAWAAADDTLGVSIMSASVKSDGTLHHGSGVVSVTKTPMSMGTYHVTFERDITTCTCVANLGGVDGTTTYALTWHVNANCPPFIAGSPTDPTLALVSTTRDLGNTYQQADASFHLLMFCPK